MVLINKQPKLSCHRRLIKVSKGAKIRNRYNQVQHDLKSIGKGNLYLGPLHIIDPILESVMILDTLSLYDQQVDSNT